MQCERPKRLVSPFPRETRYISHGSTALSLPRNGIDAEKVRGDRELQCPKACTIAAEGSSFILSSKHVCPGHGPEAARCDEEIGRAEKIGN